MGHFAAGPFKAVYIFLENHLANFFLKPQLLECNCSVPHGNGCLVTLFKIMTSMQKRD